jgi:hypothetical protein
MKEIIGDRRNRWKRQEAESVHYKKKIELRK